jgi:NAD(P)H-dependent FMN reductase
MEAEVHQYHLKIITSSVREGRKGPAITRWITSVAEQHAAFKTELLDLAAIGLPMMDEPDHPRLKKYKHEHTKQWSAKIDEADAFIFVTAEYDHNYPAPLRNALEYLLHEWAYKPAGIVSYGGVSAGTRAANSLKSDLASLKTVALFEMVNIPFFDKQINEHGVFMPNEISVKAADTMLNELLKWTKGLSIIKADHD